jgi:methylase of polypeptide subunit release factors
MAIPSVTRFGGMTQTLSSPSDAAVALLRMLKQRGYHFITPTRDTYRINGFKRAFRRAGDLDAVFGWTRAFSRHEIDPDVLTLMISAGFVVKNGLGCLRSQTACAALGNALLFHSSLSRHSEDAVFFGPDTYRFAAFLRRSSRLLPVGGRVVDLGAGTGAGALILSELRPDLTLVLSDINSEALRLARINLAAAGVKAEFVEGDGLTNVGGRIDAIIANPPYLGGGVGRLYRNGGGKLGAGLSISWVAQARARLEPGGVILLYTGSAIRRGENIVRAGLERGLIADGYSFAFEEADPDIFARTLWLPAYWDVDRIAAITLAAIKPATGATKDMFQPYG